MENLSEPAALRHPVRSAPEADIGTGPKSRHSNLMLGTTCASETGSQATSYSFEHQQATAERIVAGNPPNTKAATGTGEPALRRHPSIS